MQAIILMGRGRDVVEKHASGAATDVAARARWRAQQHSTVARRRHYKLHDLLGDQESSQAGGGAWWRNGG